MRGWISAITGLSLLATAAAAQTATDSETMAASKLFPLLDTYLGLPPTERDQFHLEYAVTGPGAAQNTHLTLKRPSGDIQMAIAPDGRILTEPNLTDLKSAQVAMTTPKGTHYGISLHLVANATPAEKMDVAPLKAGIDQARAAGRKTAESYGDDGAGLRDGLPLSMPAAARPFWRTGKPLRSRSARRHPCRSF